MLHAFYSDDNMRVSLFIKGAANNKAQDMEVPSSEWKLGGSVLKLKTISE